MKSKNHPVVHNTCSVNCMTIHIDEFIFQVNTDESELDISNSQSINAEGSGFDADGEMSDITVRETKKRERKIVRTSPNKKKRSPTSKKTLSPKQNESGSSSGGSTNKPK